MTTPNKSATLVFGGLAAVIVVLVAAGLVVSTLRERSERAASATTTTSTVAPATTTTTPAAGSNCRYRPSAEPAAKPVEPPQAGPASTDPAPVTVTLTTSEGPIPLLLDRAKAPCTVNSFLSLATKGFFDDTPCHRLTTAPSLGVLQCGDPSGEGTGGPGYQFADEYPADQYRPGDPALDRPIPYPRGTLAMANAGPGTNGSQFFLVYQDSQLPPKYTIFGRIADDGLATLDKVAAGGVKGEGNDGPPVTPVKINTVQVS